MPSRITRVGQNLALTHGAGATTVSTPPTSNTANPMPLVLNGVLRQIFVFTPAAVDASATITVNLIDFDGTTVWTKGTIAANTISNTLLTQDLSVPLGGKYQIQVVFSAAQTATDTTTKVVLMIDEG